MAEHLRDLPPPARPWRLVGAIAAGALAALGLGFTTAIKAAGEAAQNIARRQ